MRILWFTNTPSNYQKEGKGYNGGGWISSLESQISRHKDVELAISFILPDQPFKVIRNNVIYYPIELSKNNKYANIYYHFINNTHKIDNEITQYIQVINDFKPDIIEIFGSEQSFGLVSQYTNIPIVLHIQGFINLCYNAYLPPFVSWKDLVKNKINLKHLISNYIHKKVWINKCKQEQIILRNINHFIGRTNWDKRITQIYNPYRNYYHGDEILRKEFYISESKRIIPETLIIVSTISAALYKGFDLILKTANILKNQIGVNFIWKVFGNIDAKFTEKYLKMKSCENNISLMGIATAEEIKYNILHCTCFFHPSYIDNSPNSICEAQILGCPVISTNVGGIPSLITDNVTGFLIPSNDPYQASYLINLLYTNKTLNEQIGNAAKQAASKRHNRQDIVNRLINVYNKILQETKNDVK